jgi:hypothetical protein
VVTKTLAISIHTAFKKKGSESPPATNTEGPTSNLSRKIGVANTHMTTKGLRNRNGNPTHLLTSQTDAISAMILKESVTTAYKSTEFMDWQIHPNISGK